MAVQDRNMKDLLIIYSYVYRIIVLLVLRKENNLSLNRKYMMVKIISILIDEKNNY